jgi:hypothetical protein
MNKNKKLKNTRKGKRRIYIRPNNGQGSSPSDNSRSGSKKLKVSKANIYHDPANTIFRKIFRDGIPLIQDERLELNHIEKLFEGLECYKDEDVCNARACRFAGIPEEWVLNEGFEFLCDLVYNYIENGHSLIPPKGGDAMSRRLPGDGFRYH